MEYQHGGDIYGTNKIETDFSVNTNPLGMPEAVRQAVHGAECAWERYPDSLCRSLRRGLAEFCGNRGIRVSEECFLFGNGASDLLYAAAFALRPKRALLAAPAFSEYEKALKAAGCEIRYLMLREETGFSPEAEETELFAVLSAENDGERPDMILLGNPNNPDGQAVSSVWMKKLADHCREAGVILVVDECFNWFLRNREDYSLLAAVTEEAAKDGAPSAMEDASGTDFEESERYGHVILLNAFTKIFAMAGLRLGFAVCTSRELREQIESVRQPWSVSAPAEAAALAALTQSEFIDETVRAVEEERETLTEGLRALGFHVYPSMVNYILFRKRDGDETDYASFCLKQGILIRSCGNFRGLDARYYRIAVRRPVENRALLKCLAEAAAGNTVKRAGAADITEAARITGRNVKEGEAE